MRCAVCGLDGAEPYALASGKIIGAAHSGGCGALLWEGTLLKQTCAEPWEWQLYRWEVRRHVAEATGQPFSEAPPRSPSEAACDAAIALAGLSDIARELE